jgi:hypothetical protein
MYAPSQQPQGQLQKQHSVYTGNYLKKKNPFFFYLSYYALRSVSHQIY